MSIRALMVDVDGVLVDGRPDDGRHWQSALERDLGVAPQALQEHFFAPYWAEIVVGRADLFHHLARALQIVAPNVNPAALLSCWFERDSRVVTALLPELAQLRSAGIHVYLATNQEHLRATYLMDTLKLAAHVDGTFYSARLGVKKPETAFFTTVQAAVELPGDSILLLDDSCENVLAAEQAGWRAFHWTPQTAPTIIRELVSGSPARESGRDDPCR